MPDGVSGDRTSAEFRRRLIYMMLFRTLLISAVLGTTILLSWLSDVDLTSPSSLVMFVVIGTTYLLTLVYSLLLRRSYDLHRLGVIQLGADLAITTVLTHVTGGAQSAFTFLYPLAVIAGAIFFFRRGAVYVAVLAFALFTAIACLGWLDVIPVPLGSRIIPAEQSAVEFTRSLGLNLAAIIGIAALASNLGDQLHRTSARLESERSAAADLLTLHEEIVRSLPSGLITTDLANRVQTWNRAAVAILGLAAVDLDGADIDELLPGLHASQGSQPGGRVHLEIERPNEGGERQILQVSISPLVDHRDRTLGTVVNFEDLTALRRMEDDVKRSERLALIGELAAGVAHEIRNPLASISGSVELLKSAPESEDSAALMDIVIREIDRLNTLITELLDFTNPRPAQNRRIELRSLCRETVRVFEQDRAFDGVELALEAPAEVEVDADPEKLRQVLWNLLRNAAEAAGTEQGRVRVAVESNRGRVFLRVIDNGPGIPPDKLARIFDPFFTTKARGSGLGLATAYAIISQLGGEIMVTSTPGRETRFTVAIPSAETPRGGARPDAQPSGASSGTTKD